MPSRWCTLIVERLSVKVFHLFHDPLSPSRHVCAMEFGGMMFWDISNEDFQSSGLVRATHEVLRGNRGVGRKVTFA